MKLLKKSPKDETLELLAIEIKELNSSWFPVNVAKNFQCIYSL